MSADNQIELFVKRPLEPYEVEFLSLNMSKDLLDLLREDFTKGVAEVERRHTEAGKKSFGFRMFRFSFFDKLTGLVGFSALWTFLVLPLLENRELITETNVTGLVITGCFVMQLFVAKSIQIIADLREITQAVSAIEAVVARRKTEFSRLEIRDAYKKMSTHVALLQGACREIKGMVDTLEGDTPDVKALKHYARINLTFPEPSKLTEKQMEELKPSSVVQPDTKAM